MQLVHECLVLVTGNPLLQGGYQVDSIPIRQSILIEPQSRKDFATQPILARPQHLPRNCLRAAHATKAFDPLYTTQDTLLRYAAEKFAISVHNRH